MKPNLRKIAVEWGVFTHWGTFTLNTENPTAFLVCVQPIIWHR